MLSRTVINKRRMHLHLVAEALCKQNKLRQRHAAFARWKLFVVMKAVTALATGGAGGGLARLPTVSTSNGGGPIPLTLLIKAGKRVAVKKRVMSTTRIYSSPMHIGPQSPSVSSPCLGNLGVFPLPTPSSFSGGETYVPSCYQSSSGSGTGMASEQAPGEGLDGYGGYGVTTSPVSASEMTQAALAKEVQALRNTVEQQKRCIDMRDRYLNEILRAHDADASSRDLERDHLMQQLRRKGSKGGSGGSVTSNNEHQAGVVVAPPPTSVPTSAVHHSSQTSPSDTMMPESAVEGFADQYTAVVAPVFPMPPPTSPSSNAPGSGQSTTRGAYDGQRKRNSVDNASLARFGSGGDGGAPLSSRSKGEHKDVEDPSPSSSVSGGSSMSMALVTAGNKGAGGGGGRRSSIIVSTVSKRNNCVASSQEIQGTSATRDFVSLSISSIHKPPTILTTGGSDGTMMEQPAGGGTLTARGASTLNLMAASSSSTSLPTSSRRVPALRGTSLLPHIPPNGAVGGPPGSKPSPVAAK